MDEAVRAAIVRYFQGEKMAGVATLPVGLLLAAVAAWLLLRGTRYRPAAWPLGVGALVLLGVGIVLALRSDGQAQALLARLDAAALTTETTRIARVVTTFTWLKVLWCTLIVAATVAPYVVGKPWVRPVSIGITVDAALLLVFDIVADGRAREYLDALRG